MREEQRTVIDSTNDPFQKAIADYVVAEAEVQAATARRDAAKRAVVRARPAGVTSVEVTRRLKAAAVEAEKLVQIAVTKNRATSRSIVIDHVTLPEVKDRASLMGELDSLTRATGVALARL